MKQFFSAVLTDEFFLSCQVSSLSAALLVSGTKQAREGKGEADLVGTGLKGACAQRQAAW